MGEMRFLSEEGDSKIMWDADNEAEVEGAEAQFDLLIDKGYKAFKVKKDGEAGVEIKKFNPALGKIILVPPIEGG